MITEVEFDEEGDVIHCLIEAVMTKNERAIDWHELKDDSLWLQGWK